MSERHLDTDSASVQTYVTLLQANVSRMGDNSAACKTWCITVTAGILAVAIDIDRPPVAFAAVLPVLVFGLLDAFYLSLERDYRHTYDAFIERLHAARAAPEDVFEMCPPAGDSRRLRSTLSALTSVSVWPGYSVLLVSVAGAALFIAT